MPSCSIKLLASKWLHGPFVVFGKKSGSLWHLMFCVLLWASFYNVNQTLFKLLKYYQEGAQLCLSFVKMVKVKDNLKPNMIRLKKKYFVSKLARIFQTDAACGFLFFILFFFSLQLAFASTHIRNQKWLKSFNFHIFRNQTGFYHVFWAPTCLNFFQNSKLYSFFVVKMKKKIISRKKKWKSEFCKIKCAQKNKCRRQLWDTEFFFLA